MLIYVNIAVRKKYCLISYFIFYTFSDNTDVVLIKWNFDYHNNFVMACFNIMIYYYFYISKGSLKISRSINIIIDIGISKVK